MKYRGNWQFNLMMQDLFTEIIFSDVLYPTGTNMRIFQPIIKISLEPPIQDRLAAYIKQLEIYEYGGTIYRKIHTHHLTRTAYYGLGCP